MLRFWRSKPSQLDMTDFKLKEWNHRQPPGALIIYFLRISDSPLRSGTIGINIGSPELKCWLIWANFDLLWDHLWAYLGYFLSFLGEKSWSSGDNLPGWNVTLLGSVIQTLDSPDLNSYSPKSDNCSTKRLSMTQLFQWSRPWRPTGLLCR